MSQQPQVINRSSARAEIKARLDDAARAEGFADHDAAMDDDYAQWQERAGLTLRLANA